MFFIYGAGAFLQPVMRHIAKYPLVMRGSVYVLVIFAIEFTCGYIMTLFHACPWDYSSARFNVLGIIRLDYAPLWFIVGVFFEYAHGRLDGII